MFYVFVCCCLCVMIGLFMCCSVFYGTLSHAWYAMSVSLPVPRRANAAIPGHRVHEVLRWNKQPRHARVRGLPDGHICQISSNTTTLQQLTTAGCLLQRQRAEQNVGAKRAYCKSAGGCEEACGEAERMHSDTPGPPRLLYKCTIPHLLCTIYIWLM